MCEEEKYQKVTIVLKNGWKNFYSRKIFKREMFLKYWQKFKIVIKLLRIHVNIER